MAKISQREARRLVKRVSELEAARAHQLRQWATEWPGGVHIETRTVAETLWAAISTARKLGHAIVITAPNKDELRYYALPLAK